MQLFKGRRKFNLNKKSFVKKVADKYSLSPKAWDCSKVAADAGSTTCVKPQTAADKSDAADSPYFFSFITAGLCEIS